MPTIDLRADLNAEDDEGRWWSLLHDATNPAIVVLGAVLIAGTDRFWSIVQIEQVDDDGQLHFVAVPPDDPAATRAARSYASRPTRVTSDLWRVTRDPPRDRRGRDSGGCLERRLDTVLESGLARESPAPKLNHDIFCSPRQRLAQDHEPVSRDQSHPCSIGRAASASHERAIDPEPAQLELAPFKSPVRELSRELHAKVLVSGPSRRRRGRVRRDFYVACAALLGSTRRANHHAWEPGEGAVAPTDKLRIVAARETAFVGREAEIAELSAVLHEARAGRGAFVLLTGAAGIGKTRLAQEVTAAAHWFDVVWAACGPRDGTPPFWPWTQVVRALLARSPAWVRRAESKWPAVAELAGERPVASRVNGDGRAEARAALFDDVASLVAACASERPLLVLLDDLHDADPSSRLLLEHLATRCRSVPLVVVATWRTGMSAHDRPDSSVSRSARVLALSPLGADDVAVMVDAVAGAASTPALVASLHRRSSGNPLLVHELVNALRDTGSLVDAPAVDALVPDSVHATVAARLGALADRDREVVATAAAIGTVFLIDVLAAATGCEEREVLDALTAALDAAILARVESSSGAFTHDVVRDAVYGDDPPAARARRHERIVDALARLRDRGHAVEPADLARHAQAAGAPLAVRALAYTVEAGDRAMTCGAYEEAAGLYDEALEMGGSGVRDPAERAQLLIATGDARSAVGDRDGARRALLEAAEFGRAAGRPDLLADAALALGEPGGFEVPLLDAEQIGMLDEALASLPDADRSRRAAVMARLSVAVAFRDSEGHRLDLSDEALRLARDSGDDRTRAQTLAARCDAIAGPDHVVARFALGSEIVDMGTRARDRRLQLLGHRHRLVVALEQGDIATVDREIRAFATVAASLRRPLYSWYVPLWGAMRALMRGDLEAAARLVDEAQTTGAAAGSGNAFDLAMSFRWVMAGEAAHWDVIAAIMPDFDAHNFPGVWAFVTRALASAQVGAAARARTEFEAAAARLADAERDSEWLPMMSQFAELVGRLDVGAHPVVEQAYEWLLPYRHLFAVEGIGAAVRSSVERDLGVLAAALGHAGVAVAHFDAAIAANERIGATLLVARALHDAGEALDDRERLTAARDLYRELGVEGRAQEIDARLGVVARRAVPDRGEFRRRGDTVRIGFAGTEATVRDAKGMRDLALLLAQPMRPIPAVELAGGGSDVPVEGSAGEMIDGRARAEYERRLSELDAAIESADRAGEAGRSARAVAERDALVAQLAEAYGLGGRPRHAGDPAERARSTVTVRIRDAIGKIDAVHPALGRHLRHSVKTGRLCSYEPEAPIEWDLSS